MRVTKCAVLSIALIFLYQAASAEEDVNDSNCMQQIGRGGFADFECYEGNAKQLERDNQKVAMQIRQLLPRTSSERDSLNRFMNAEDEAAKHCDLAVDLSYTWSIDSPPKTHRNMYDVMSARCRYNIRKQESDFLLDLLSIKTD
jgi:hypothetical protein